jgi:hypothetical protein
VAAAVQVEQPVEALVELGEPFDLARALAEQLVLGAVAGAERGDLLAEAGQLLVVALPEQCRVGAPGGRGGGAADHPAQGREVADQDEPGGVVAGAQLAGVVQQQLAGLAVALGRQVPADSRPCGR